MRKPRTGIIPSTEDSMGSPHITYADEQENAPELAEDERADFDDAANWDY